MAKTDKRKGEVYQFMDGEVSGTIDPSGRVDIFGKVYGARERVRFILTRKDAVDLSKWLKKALKCRTPKALKGDSDGSA